MCVISQMETIGEHTAAEADAIGEQQVKHTKLGEWQLK